MNATQLFKEGRLQEAIDAQAQDVKKNPTDTPRRLFLFELLAFAGDLDRARKQIDAIRLDDLERSAVLGLYRNLLAAEAERRLLFAEGKAPQFLGTPPGHVPPRIQAAAALAQGDPAAASAHLAAANAAAPARAGTLNGRPFARLRDADDRFGPVLEVFANNGVYSWVPLEQVESVVCKPPKSPRDLLWFPAQLRTREGQTGAVFLPALYPGSAGHDDPAVRLGRRTDWHPLAGGAVVGVGQRTFAADDEAVGVLEWRELRFAPPAG